MERIRWDAGSYCFVLSDGTQSDQDGEFKLKSAVRVSLSSVRRALAQKAGVSIPPLGSLPAPKLYPSWREFSEAAANGPNAEISFDIGLKDTDPIYFFLTSEGHLRAHFAIRYPALTDENEDIVVEIVERLFGDLCVLLQELSYVGPYEDDFPAWYFHIITNPTGATVGSFWEACNSLFFALRISEGNLIKSIEGVQLALRLGRPELLVGAIESSWLEAKSYDYHRLSSGVEKIKLAQDVARFANADGGLLVLGLKTSLSNGIDTISRVTPLPLPERSSSQYRKTIDAHVYPLVRGLEVFSIPYANGELLVINIPSQLDDDKPFVVHGNLGEISDKRVRGQFVSVVHRRGDGAEFLSGPAIHGLLANKKRFRDE
jgi:hypothetical protein